ncbi:hypothetical protein [Pseudorhodoferax sp.]|uniref:hypothetical protein n=1 Tax=Pseudorhodoferax sp. TaxID=1993553 RepID=UPI002DD6A679|nr:hypothetical protein [Pseudorhodoferax sp.]
MGIAMLTAARVVRMPQWLDDLAPRVAARLGVRLRRHSPHTVEHARPRPAPALRVLRVFEPHQPRAAAGRMVISGRMADVCAELDRLAAAESMQAPH